MVKHSKNNTNSAQFSYAERKMISHGTKKERLGRDAMRNFDACSLCLARAIEPRCCSEGHIFCQECALNSLISQKKDIKRQNLILERMKATEKDELLVARAAARSRVLKEFEHTQSGLSSKPTTGKVVAVASGSGSGNGEKNKGIKRKFDLDEAEIERLTKEGEDEAIKTIEREKAEAIRAKLPAFWLPSLTPSARPHDLADIKLQTLCQIGKPHPMSLKTLTTIKFEEDPTDTAEVGNRTCICGVCRKSLSNNLKSFALKPCGDVVCITCVDLLCKPDKACAHCGTALAEKDGLIELNIEGTGFSSGGVAEASRFDLPLQC